MSTEEVFSFKNDWSFNRRKSFAFFSFIVLFFLAVSIILISDKADAATRELVFDPSPDTRVIGYKLYYGESESSDTTNFDINSHESTVIDLQKNTSYGLPDLKEGVTYYFAATAYAGDGEEVVESVFSDILFYTVPINNNYTYTISASAGMGGIISPSGDILVNHGTSQEFTITPETGMTIQDVLVNGISVGKVSNYTFSNVTSSQTISASFETSVNSDPDSTLQIIEMGEALVNDQWQRVSFTGLFIDPVVVAKPASLNDPTPAVVRIQNVNENGFDIRVQEWDYLDGKHGYEQISYLAVEKGSYILPGEIRLEAGTFQADGNNFRFNPFIQPFNHTPVVIASVTSINGKNAVVGRTRNISTSGFEYYLQEQEKNKVKHGMETISFIACEPFSGVFNRLTMEVGTTGTLVNQNFHYLSYNKPFSNIPHFIADMQTINDSETANLRWQNKNRYSVEVQISEEKSRDAEVNHSNENVGYIIISNE